MQVQVVMDPTSSGWCRANAGTTAAITAAVNPIAGGVFGLVGICCG